MHLQCRWYLEVIMMTKQFAFITAVLTLSIARIFTVAAVQTSPTSCPTLARTLVALPTGKTCTGRWKEVKDAKGCTASWECAGQ